MLAIADDLTADEREALRARMFTLLASRARYLTMGDSASLPVETAEKLLASIRYALTAHLELTAQPLRTLLTCDLDALYRAAITTLARELERGRALYALACETRPAFRNRSLEDTLRSMPAFFAGYDPRTFAQETPCDVDYQLCVAVPEQGGVRYINHYLTHLLIENAFLARCDPARVARVLNHSCPDAYGLLINLYQPVCEQACLAAMAGGDIAGLSMGEGARRDACAALSHMTADACRRAIHRAADSACEALGLRDEPSREYARLGAAHLAYLRG